MSQPLSPNARKAGAIATMARAIAPSNRRPRGHTRSSAHRKPTPSTSELVATISAKITLFRAQVHAKSSKRNSTTGKKCDDARGSPVGPSSTRIAATSATNGASSSEHKSHRAIFRNNRKVPINARILLRPAAPHLLRCVKSPLEPKAGRAHSGAQTRREAATALADPS